MLCADRGEDLVGFDPNNLAQSGRQKEGACVEILAQIHNRPSHGHFICPPVYSSWVNVKAFAAIWNVFQPTHFRVRKPV
jgi:hypothetical protein